MNTTTIENQQFRADIRLKGAELASLRHKPTGRELIWQADPEIWQGSAPILFPIVGKLKHGITHINGVPYEIPKHGLLRTRDARLIEKDDNFAAFQFTSDDETLKQYPFPFVFTVYFHLLENGLEIHYVISNTGSEPMLFTVGSHPAFALDLESHVLSDYSIELSERETVDLHGLKNGLLSRRYFGHLRSQNSIQLSDSLFDEDAVILEDIWSRSVRIEPAGVEIELGNHPHLAIWSKPGAPYVCVEPWHSYDDSPDSDGIFENKPGILRLDPGKSFNTDYAIRILL